MNAARKGRVQVDGCMRAQPGEALVHAAWLPEAKWNATLAARSRLQPNITPRVKPLMLQYSEP